MEDEALRKRLVKVTGDLTSLVAQVHDKILAINAILAQDEAPDSPANVKRAKATFSHYWQKRHVGAGLRGLPEYAYQFAHARDGAQIKRLLLALGIDELEARMARYFQSDDPFHAQNRHPFALFVSQINRFVPVNGNAILEPVPEILPPADCQHTPRCQTDQEHTKRRALEMRS